MKRSYAGASGLLLALALASLPATGQTGSSVFDPALDPRELVTQLHHAGLDPAAAYRVEEIYLRRDAIRLELTHGTLMFFQPVAGVVTGAVFVGEGRILVMPPIESERRQLAYFTGSPILAEPFTSAYLRFTDETLRELEALLRAGRGRLTDDREVLAQWEGTLRLMNVGHSVRVLAELLNERPRPFFYASLQSPRLGLFDVTLDEQLNEEVLVGQPRWREQRGYYDLWCAFPREGTRRGQKPPTALPEGYRLQTTIEPDYTLEGAAEVRFRAGSPGQRLVPFEISRWLRVSEVSDELGQPLAFFQNDGLAPEEWATRGLDQVVVVMPEPLAADVIYTLHFRYRGQVIADLGDGVLYVGARGIWYPSVSSQRVAPFEMEFRYPRALSLVASGTPLQESEQGEWRQSRWASEVPIPFAGFNLGSYDSHQRVHNGIPLSVHANRQLEPALARPLARPLPPPVDLAELPRLSEVPGRTSPPLGLPLPAVPRPSSQMEQVAEEVAQALDFFASRFGRFPYPRLTVSQIPGGFGQGYPGLLYLSTFSFIPAREQVRLGLSERTREYFSGLVPAHETSHQWWGNRVQVAGYRDQWLLEALATYSTLLYLESKPGGDQTLRRWLERYRNDLLAKNPDQQTWEASGPLVLGRRLNSSRSPGGYERVIYPKGAWVMHMVRHLLTEPVFFELLRTIVDDYGHKPLSTEELQALVEQRMPRSADIEGNGSLDWFFDQWVRNTGIPHYRLQARVEPRAGGYRVRGRVEQRGVSDLFTMPVPVYALTGKQLRWLGVVVVTGTGSSFDFLTPTRPGRVVLDPYQTVLCVIE